VPVVRIVGVGWGELVAALRSRRGDREALALAVRRVNAWCRQYGIVGGTSPGAFTAAACAAAVRMSPADSWHFNIEFALSVAGGIASPLNAWRDVLASCVPPPLELRRPVQPVRARPNFRLSQER